jgi:hypothetical protein
MSRHVKRILVVVRCDEAELYARMRERYGAVAHVVLDRRQAERRRQTVFRRVERRHRTRRQSWTAEDLRRWLIVGYRLFYRAEGVQTEPCTNALPD